MALKEEIFKDEAPHDRDAHIHGIWFLFSFVGILVR